MYSNHDILERSQLAKAVERDIYLGNRNLKQNFTGNEKARESKTLLEMSLEDYEKKGYTTYTENN